jgi:hypothetical protein
MEVYMSRFFGSVLSLALMVAAVGAAAQGPTPQPAPPVGDQAAPQPGFPPELPGLGQPHVSLKELAERVFRIPKKNAVQIAPDRIRATGIMNTEFLLVGEEGDFYLVKELPPEDPKSALHRAWAMQQTQEARGIARQEYMADKYIISDVPDIYPPFTDKLDFELRNEGLPKGGRWQMSFDVADMNGDGRPDLVLPPPRLGAPHPFIFLQQPDHTWRLWSDARWPDAKTAKLDYGTVRVADFDGDGHPDIALASHFSDTFVLYGDGKGDFTHFDVLPRANTAISARCLTVADFNNDGRPDVATLAEINLNVATNRKQSTGLVNVFLNLPSGWKSVGEGFPTEIQGDWISAADFDRDGWVDLLLTTRMEGIPYLFMRNLGKGERWQAVATSQVPYNSFVFANASAPLDRFKSPDVVLCFEQFNALVKEDPAQACAIYHFHDAKGRPSLTPHQELFLKRKVVYDNFKVVAVGDIDGDGRNDIAVVTSDGAVRIFLQFPDGTFYEERSPELTIGDTEPFDVRIADLYGDGKGEVIVMGSPHGTGPGGGVWVFAPHRKAPPRGKPTLDKPHTGD